MGNKKKTAEGDRDMSHQDSIINVKDDLLSTPEETTAPDFKTPLATIPKNRIRLGLTLTVIGYLIFLLGVRPGLFGLDRSKVIGFVQITVFLIGLAIIVIGAYVTLINFWPRSKSSLLADFGVRVISTGYVICVFTALADIFGFGSHHLPNVFFGPLQANGVEIGMIVIGLGFIMMVRFNHKSRK